ncbi:hypothetical protein B0H13DRAFT_1878692 [Mycena leptocephala]|nr:hypothetical protein B0H13DRAFT_1878692 [Mycena leptocephala]
MINMLLEAPNIRLVSRIEGLLSRGSGVLPPDLGNRRRVSCFRTIWSIVYFAASDSGIRKSFPIFDKTLALYSMFGTCDGYSLSSLDVVRWCRFCALAKLVREATAMLGPAGANNAVQDPRGCLTMVQDRASQYGYAEYSEALSSILSLDPVGASTLVQRSREALMAFEDYAYDTLLEYMRDSAALPDMPYEFETTLNGLGKNIVVSEFCDPI